MAIQHVEYHAENVLVHRLLIHSVKRVNLSQDLPLNMFVPLVKKVILDVIVNCVPMAIGEIHWHPMENVFHVNVHQLVQFRMYATNKRDNVIVKKVLPASIVPIVHRDMLSPILVA